MILTKTHLQRCVSLLRNEDLRAPYFRHLLMDSRYSVVELVAKNGGGAEGCDGAMGLDEAGAPELNNVSLCPVMIVFPFESLVPSFELGLSPCRQCFFAPLIVKISDTAMKRVNSTITGPSSRISAKVP